MTNLMNYLVAKLNFEDIEMCDIRDFIVYDSQIGNEGLHIPSVPGFGMSNCYWSNANDTNCQKRKTQLATLPSKETEERS